MDSGSNTDTFGSSSPENLVAAELEEDDEDDEDDDDDELDRCRLLVDVWEPLVASPAAVRVLVRAKSGVVKLSCVFSTSVVDLGFDMSKGSSYVTGLQVVPPRSWLTVTVRGTGSVSVVGPVMVFPLFTLFSSCGFG